MQFMKYGGFVIFRTVEERGPIQSMFPLIVKFVGPKSTRRVCETPRRPNPLLGQGVYTGSEGAPPSIPPPEGYPGSQGHG